MPENIITAKKDIPSQPAAPAPVAEKGFLVNWFLEYYRFATAGACLVLLAAGYWLVAGPKIARVKTVRTVLLAQEQQRRDDLERQLAYLAKLTKKKEDIGAEALARIDDMLPADAGLPALFAAIEGLGRDSGVSIESININVSSADKKSGRGAAAGASPGKALPEGVKTVDLTLAVTAEDYRQLKIFLGNLERSQRLMDAVALNYSPGGVGYILTVRAYFQPVKKSDEPAAAAVDGT